MLKPQTGESGYPLHYVRCDWALFNGLKGEKLCESYEKNAEFVQARWVYGPCL